MVVGYCCGGGNGCGGNGGGVDGGGGGCGGGGWDHWYVDIGYIPSAAIVT